MLSRCQLVTAGALSALGEREPPAAALAVTIGSVPEAVRAQGSQVADVCARAGSPADRRAAGRRWWQRVAEVTWPEGPATPPHAADRDPADRCRQGAAGGRGDLARRRLAPGHPERGHRCPPRDPGAHRGPPRARGRRTRPRGSGRASTARASSSTRRRRLSRGSTSGATSGPRSRRCGVSSTSSTRRPS